MKPTAKPYRFFPAPKRNIVGKGAQGRLRIDVRTNTLGRQYEESAFDGRLFCGVRNGECGKRSRHAAADGEDLLRSLQEVLLPRSIFGRRLHHAPYQLLPARMGS